MPKKKPTQLDGKQILREASKRLKKYEKLNFLEQFAMFIGSAQVLELGLKHLLARRYNYDLEQLERWTLGRTANELKKCGVREDFLFLLESVVQYRNYITHELLVNDAMIKALVGKSGRMERRHLEKGIFELEQIMFLHDWIEEYGAWEVPSAQQVAPGDAKKRRA
jgi:hypothetical protein